MAKRFKTRKSIQGNSLPVTSVTNASRPKSAFKTLIACGWLPLLLAAITFLVYWPSLSSDFVYDGRYEIFEEGFITSLANLPAVLSLHVLGMNILLGDRPADLLYMMLNAAIWGKDPWGYHLSGNLLHVTNVALLFVLLRRLVAMERVEQSGNNGLKILIALMAVTLIFALHPIATEPVVALNYSYDLLVVFFTLSALLAATAFRPENFQTAVITGGLGTFCAFAAVASKESGLAAAGLLVVYWFLYRRNEARKPWRWFLGAATTVTVAFLAARFLFAPASPGPSPTYLGGSFLQVFLIQPRIWVFMMGKLLWPAQLSADYTLENLDGLSTFLAFVILVIVTTLQAWLAVKSRLGALGVAIYWLGLVTVSNFIPLYRIMSDRFYYLPLVGVTMQLLALLLMTLRFRDGFWGAWSLCLVALPPLALLTVARENVFASEFSLWSDTVQVSPYSSNAHCNLGIALLQKGQQDEAITEFQKALEIDPNFAEAHNNLGTIYAQRGQMSTAIDQFQKALAADPNFAKAYDNLGCALLLRGQVDNSIAQMQKALAINPNYIDAHFNLGMAFVQKSQWDEAIAQFQEVLRLNPEDGAAQKNLTRAEAMAQQNANRN